MEGFVLCITGASGSIYGYRALGELAKSYKVDVIVSEAGRLVMEEELGKGPEDLKKEFPQAVFHDERDLTAPVSSGSVLSGYRAVLVMPCSMSTLASVATGVNSNLIHRVCEVALKERIRTVLLVREMPYSRVHIENMLKATEAGALVVPASPAFYHRPRSLEDMVNFVVGRVFDLIGVPHTLYNRWKGGGRGPGDSGKGRKREG